MPVRGIRGATTADGNTAEAIVEATAELLNELIRQSPHPAPIKASRSERRE